MNTHSRIATLAACSISLLLFLGMVTGVEAQTSYSGDTVCGSSSTDACTFDDAKNIITNVITQFVIPLVVAFLTVFIMYRIVTAWFAYAQGNASAWKEARSKIANAILGLIIIILVFGGLFTTLLTVLGVQPWALKFLELLSDGIIPQAYAQGTATSGMLPNPTSTNNLYDFLLGVLTITIRWFIVPLMLGLWTWTGFSFVLAQGRPEAITKAKKLLGVALGSTILIISAEGFLYAVRDTVTKIVPAPQQTTQTSTTGSPGTPDGRTPPSTGTPGATCEQGGEYGRVGTDGKCYTANGCAGKRTGDACKTNGRAGTCDQSEEGVFGCYATVTTSKTPGESCQTVDGRFGQIGVDGSTCYASSGGAGR